MAEGAAVSAPETIEYILQPIVSDKGEVPATAENGDPFVVDVSVTDLADGLTIVAVPEDMDRDALTQFCDLIEKRAKKQGGQFIVVQGDISKWRFAKLIRRDKWDADYREPA